MRKILLATMGLAVTLAVPSAGRAQDAECKTIIEQAMKAQGGADKLKAVKGTTVKAKGNIEIMGMKLDFTADIYHQPPGKIKSVINLSVQGMQIEIIQVVDGKKGWASALGQVKDLEEVEIDEALAMVHVEAVTNLYVLKEDKAFQLSPLGETKVGETTAVGVQVTKKDKRDVNLYFDKKTHFLVKAEYRGLEPIGKVEVAQEKLFSDYKEMLPGLKLPSKQIINHDGKRFMDLEIAEITAVERHDDSIFRKPE
jgi:hypothetical protein